LENIQKEKRERELKGERECKKGGKHIYESIAEKRE